MAKLRVLIVDDSAVVRQTLSEIIAYDPQLEVMATASDPFFAAQRIAEAYKFFTYYIFRSSFSIKIP